jgi:hypothetical protein
MYKRTKTDTPPQVDQHLRQNTPFSLMYQGILSLPTPAKQTLHFDLESSPLAQPFLNRHAIPLALPLLPLLEKRHARRPRFRRETGVPEPGGRE